jgi:ribosomal protein S18 acetylase RimI-like enzyme
MANVLALKIKAADVKDSEQIIQLQRLAYQSEAELYQDWTIPPLMQTVENLAQEFTSLIILTAIINGEIVGSVRAKLENDVAHIGRLIVHPDFQKQGIGSALLQKIEEILGHAKSYELFTGSKSKNNIQLYLAHNYKISHTKDISDRVTLVYLCKSNCT